MYSYTWCHRLHVSSSLVGVSSSLCARWCRGGKRWSNVEIRLSSTHENSSAKQERVFLLLVSACVFCVIVEMADGLSESQFPDTLQGFGYGFNKDGELKKLNQDTNQLGDDGFEFNVCSDPEKNQKHYEALGEVITEYVYELLEAEGGLHRLYVPIVDDRNKDEVIEKSFIFASKDALTNPNRLLILIHGSGVVRAGQWARSLIINDSLKTGSQLPYIHRALELGYGVLVLNTNDNTRVVNGKNFKIKHSEDPVKHAQYVWDTFVKKAKARHIAIVAHSYGGVVVTELLHQYLDDFRRRVAAVAFTDSVHSLKRFNSKVTSYMHKVARNWVSSNEPLDTSLDTTYRDIQRVSAGTHSHEMTSASCLESAFAFVEGRLQQADCEQPAGGEQGWRRFFPWLPRT